MGPVVAPTVAAAPSVAAPAPVSAPIAAAPAVSAAPVVPASVATPPTSNEPAANDLVEVVAQGMGTDANSALNNAYSNAVQQALGLYVDAETMVQNDQVVRDQILTYSRGFIQKTDTISQGQENGLFQVKIRAQVQRQQLLEKAKASNISVKPVQGATLYAQIKSQSKQVEDAGNLIKKAFEPLTKIDFYRAQIVGEPTVVKEKINSETTVLEYKFILWVDEPQYLDYVNKQLIPVLDQIAIRKDTIVVNINKKNNNSYYYDYSNDNTKNIINSKNAIAVMFWRNKSISSSKWFVYNLSPENYEKITDILGKNTQEQSIRVRVTIDLLDENNQLVASDERNSCQLCAIAYNGYRSRLYTYLVTPFFDREDSYGLETFYFLRERAFQVKVSTEDLPRVKSVKLEFKPAAG